jgi:hypothetical protein
MVTIQCFAVTLTVALIVVRRQGAFEGDWHTQLTCLACVAYTCPPAWWGSRWIAEWYEDYRLQRERNGHADSQQEASCEEHNG